MDRAAAMDVTQICTEPDSLVCDELFAIILRRDSTSITPGNDLAREARPPVGVHEPIFFLISWSCANSGRCV